MISEDRIILNNSMKYPGMRFRLVHHIRELSDPDIQRDKWFDPNIFANFDEVVHFLFDESTLADDAKGCVGFYLADEKEADLIARIIRILGRLIDELGDVSDDKYIEWPEWPGVVSLAGETLKLMIENDDKQQGLAD